MTKQVYIIHGYRASSTNHWFPWLKKRLLADGVQADILNMPNPLQPRLEDWLDTLSLYQHTLHENTYLVAHSLGCPAILRFWNIFNYENSLAESYLFPALPNHCPLYRC